MLRLFIAINLPPSITSKISSFLNTQKPLFGNDIRFLPPQNWHLTLVFLGYQDEKKLPLIHKAIKNSLSQFKKPPLIELKELVYGPLFKTPRMIWFLASEKTSQQLNELKNILEEELEKQGLKWKKEKRKFEGHLTLARFFPLSKKELPTLKKLTFPLKFEAVSLDLMNSILQKTGAFYEPLFRIEW